MCPIYRLTRLVSGTTTVREAAVQHDILNHCCRDSDVQVGHENSTRLAVDNSLRIGSLHYETVS